MALSYNESIRYRKLQRSIYDDPLSEAGHGEKTLKNAEPLYTRSLAEAKFAGLTYFQVQAIAILTIVAAFVRLYGIHKPSSVVFDEVHFGGFASKYIKGEFFMDVHPPLAKMLLALVAWLNGFDGQFDFKKIGM